jgi:hypothetical protein
VPYSHKQRQKNHDGLLSGVESAPAASEAALMGQARSSRDFLFILATIRRARSL